MVLPLATTTSAHRYDNEPSRDGAPRLFILSVLGRPHSCTNFDWDSLVLTGPPDLLHDPRSVHPGSVEVLETNQTMLPSQQSCSNSRYPLVPIPTSACCPRSGAIGRTNQYQAALCKGTRGTTRPGALKDVPAGSVERSSAIYRYVRCLRRVGNEEIRRRVHGKPAPRTTDRRSPIGHANPRAYVHLDEECSRTMYQALPPSGTKKFADTSSARQRVVSRSGTPTRPA
jgi:hypothetical protein